MRVKHLHERFADFRELVVQLAMDSRGQEGKCFDDALDMRVFALVAFERKTSGYFRIALCEFAGQLAKICQFPFVVRQQVFEHDQSSLI
jgi:hypothetical protein